MILLSLLGLSVLAYQKDPAQSGWSPDKVLVNKLDSSADVDDFQLRVPASYRPVTQQGLPGSVITGWVGAARSDRTQPYVLVTIQSLPPEGDASKITPEVALNKFLEPIEKSRKNWTKTAPEKGVVNGLTFIRTRWRGQDQATGRVMHGFNYVTIKDRKIIQISSQDAESYKDGLELAEAAALTFRKRY